VAFATYAPREAGTIKPSYHLENVCRHGNNCMSCLYCTGIRKIPIIGAYLLPGQQGLDDLHTHVQTAFNQYPTNRYAPVFMGDFNVDLDSNNPNDLKRQQEVLDFLAANGELQSMVPHFRQQRRYEKMGNTTWFQNMEDGTVRRSKCDYICCRDKRLFTNVALREPETFSKTDHYMIKATFLNATPRAHKKYLLGHKKIPLQHQGPYTPADNLFRILVDNVPPPTAEGHPKTSWISQETRRLMAKRCRLHRDKHHSRQQARVLTRQITKSLKQDRKERVAAAGAEIEACLENGDLQGAWNIHTKQQRVTDLQ